MYSTLMVYLDPSADNTRLLQITGDLAERFNANVHGVSASRLVGVDYDVGGIPGGVVDRGREELDEAMEAAKQAALTLLQRPGREIEWRSIVDTCPLEAAVIRETRSADMVIASANYRGSLTRGTPYLNIGDVQVARQEKIPQAKDSVADVARWLKRHKVTAECMTLSERGRNGPQLDAVAKTEGIDLIVAGAYGHSRFREWALGGVTRNLLLYGDLCALVSH